jgi:excisionase family DNA binding protein
MATHAPTVRDLSELAPVLTIEQVADVLQLGRAKVYELVRSGELPAARLGSHYRVLRRSLAAYLGCDDTDLTDAREKRREEVDALLARYRLAQDEVSRVTARLLELGVAVAEPAPHASR